MKRTKTTETYILPEEFEQYTKSGYVIFMAKPTVFGTYKAVKIELVDAAPQREVRHFRVEQNNTITPSRKLFGSWRFGFSMQ